MADHTEEGATVADYMAVLAKRRVALMASFAAVLLAFVALAYLLPPVYRSTGTVLIEQPEVPKELLDFAANQLIEERLQTITSRATTTDNVLRLISENDLYPEMSSAPIEQRVDRFLGNLTFEPLSAESLARAGRNIVSTYAFKLTFEDRDPQKAKAVTTEIVNLYLEAHEAQRTERAGRTRGFFQAEVDRLAVRINKAEEALANFKAQNSGNLPELANMNFQVRAQLERDISALDGQIRDARARADLLRVELSRAQAEFGSSGELATLQEEYARLSTRYSPDHPDVISLQQQIEALTGGSASVDRRVYDRQITELDRRLEDLRARYAENHPDVVNAVRQRNALIERRRTAGTSRAYSAAEAPEVQEARSRRASALSEVSALSQKRDSLRQQLADYQARLALTPGIEKEYNSLQREYETAVAEHQEMLDSLQDARLAETLETSSQGERFTVLQGPRVPDAPVSPNRPAVIALGLVLAIGCALALVTILDFLDNTIRGRRDCIELFGAPPIATIPVIDKPGAVSSRGRELMQMLLVGTVFVVGVVLVVLMRAGA